MDSKGEFRVKEGGENFRLFLGIFILLVLGKKTLNRM